MIKQYILPTILIILFLLFLGITIWSMTQGIAIGSLNILSIGQLEEQNLLLESSKAQYSLEEIKYKTAITKQESAKKQYNESKTEYDSIEQTKIEQVEEALKGINYYLDWLWIEVGNYAEKNNLDISIKEPEGSQFSTGEADGAITIEVVGMYQDIVDFVFDIENDNELKFKLDNISMAYMNANYMRASFKVLNVNVLFKDK